MFLNTCVHFFVSVGLQRCKLVKHNHKILYRLLCAKDDKKKPKFPEAPTTCCMSGCANCVWLEYAEKLTKYFQDGGEQAMKEINEKVEDPSIRAYLLHELRMRKAAQENDDK